MFNFNNIRSAFNEKPKPVVERFEDISEAGDIKDLLESQGLLDSSVNLTNSDYEAIITRAGKLKESDPGLSQDEAIGAAFIDRMSVLGEVGIALLDKIPVETLQEMFAQRTGHEVTADEVQMFMSYLKTGHKPETTVDVAAVWDEKRHVAAESVPDNTAVVDAEGKVVELGPDSAVDLLKRAVEGRGG